MKKNDRVRRNLSLFTAIVIGLFSGSAGAAIFMEIPGIPGESKDSNHDGWIDVLHTSGTFAANSCGDFVVTKEMDKAFPLLVTSVVAQTVFPQIVLEYTATYGGSRATYAVITLDGATITNISSEASGNDEAGPPVESLSIAASSIQIEYTEYDSQGSSLGQITETVICGKSKDK